MSEEGQKEVVMHLLWDMNKCDGGADTEQRRIADGAKRGGSERKTWQGLPFMRLDGAGVSAREKRGGEGEQIRHWDLFDACTAGRANRWC